jgi:hypothetical protein
MLDGLRKTGLRDQRLIISAIGTSRIWRYVQLPSRQPQRQEQSQDREDYRSEDIKRRGRHVAKLSQDTVSREKVEAP